MAMLRYRSLLPTDESLLWSLFYYAISVPPGQPAPPRDVIYKPELARYVRDWGTRAGDHGVGAEVDGTLIGAAWLRLWNVNDHGYGFVDERTPELSMAVLAEYRAQGVGTELLRRLLAEADLQNKSVSLSVSEYNPARRLYERTGFVSVGTVGDSITMLRNATR
jgi:GNAT superfamily N-acetyltransferase